MATAEQLQKDRKKTRKEGRAVVLTECLEDRYRRMLSVAVCALEDAAVLFFRENCSESNILWQPFAG